MLLPSAMRAYLGVGFKWGETCCTLPFNWNEEEQRVSLAPSRGRIALWLLSIAFTATISGGAVLNLARSWNTEEMKTNDAVRHHSCYKAMATFTLLQHQVAVALRFRFFPQTMNTFLAYIQEFEEKYRGRIRKVWDSKLEDRTLTTVLQLNYYAIHATFTSQLIYIAFNPSHVLHLAPLSQIPWVEAWVPRLGNKLSLDGVIVTGFVGLIYQVICTTNVYFWIFEMVPLIYVLGNIVTELRLPNDIKRRTYWTTSRLRLPRWFTKVSREVCLLTKLLVDVLSPMLLVVPLGIISAMTFTAFEAIKEKEAMQKLSMAVMFLQVLAVHVYLNIFAGKFPKLFQQNLEDFKSAYTSKEAKRVWKSFRVPALEVYGLYKMGKAMTVSGLLATLDNLVSCLTVA